MDDIICLIRWMNVTGCRLSIHMVPIPVLSGPTCGRTIEYEFMAWARQWPIGTDEVFHYFIVKSRGISFLVSFSWSITFLIYYGILLCSSGLYDLAYFITTLFLLEDLAIYLIYVIYILISIEIFSFFNDIFCTYCLLIYRISGFT